MKKINLPLSFDVLRIKYLNKMFMNEIKAHRILHRIDI